MPGKTELTVHAPTSTNVLIRTTRVKTDRCAHKESLRSRANAIMAFLAICANCSMSVLSRHARSTVWGIHSLESVQKIQVAFSAL